MPFEPPVAPVPIRQEILTEFRREWRRLAAPGPTWSGAERVEIAAAARGAGAGSGGGASGAVPEDAVAAARLIAAEPAVIRREWVEERLAVLGSARYVEVVGVVSRLSSVDGFHQALGLPLEPLPEPEPGSPTGEVDDRARPGRGWVPMVGATSIVGALSIVPAEMAAQESLHGPIYLTYEGMADPDFHRGLRRSQMELIAARVSAQNECFY